MAAQRDRWAIIVPVKRLTLAKTRLALPAEARIDLALALATDTVDAALRAASVGQVLVVSDDERAVAALAGLGAKVVPDEPDAGLNPALRHGVDVALAAGAAAVGALSADLPALVPGDLDAVLASAAAYPLSAVADASGSGTTLLLAGDPAHFVPAFGANSRAAHVGAGARDLTDTASASLRRDVDTLEDLAAALAMGVGGATRRWVEAHRELLPFAT